MKNMRFSLLLILLLSCSLLQPITGQTRQTTATINPVHITLSWTADPATSMTITWRTAASVDSGFVQYKTKTSHASEALTSEAQAHEFTTDLGTSKIFSATLTGLIPDTEYMYQVGNSDRWSKKYSFKTSATEINAFKFLVFGDSQSPVTGNNPYGVWRQTLHSAFEANPDAAFIINVGDLVDYGQSEAHWDAWFEASKGVIDTIPAMVIPGNHESYGMGKIGKPTFFVKQFFLPQNGPASLKNQVYSFDYGPVHIVMLDSQAVEQRNSGNIFSVQKPWLTSDLSSSNAIWKIASFHRAPYGVKPDRDESELRNAFCPILEKYGVNLVFNGHDHGIKRTYPLKDGTPVENPLEGTTYYVTGHSGPKAYPDVEPMKYSAFFYASPVQPNYLVVEGTNKEISVKIVLQDGRVIDTFTIEKP